MEERDETLSEPDQEHPPIPVELHSVYESGPFTRCTICDGPLRDPPSGQLTVRDLACPRPQSAEDSSTANGPVIHQPHDGCGQGSRDTDRGAVYEIQKVFRGPEVQFEMAICRRCGEQVAKEFSEESIEAMKGFLLSNFKPDKEASHCHFCTFPLALLEGWTMVGACREDRLIFPPIILCEPCSENLQQRLSKKTRDVQDEFIRDHFPGVPADLDFSPSVFGV